MRQFVDLASVAVAAAFLDLVSGYCLGCGGGAGEAKAPSVAASPPGPAGATTGSPAATLASHADGDAYDDPDEVHDPATLTPLISKGQKLTFPKATVGEQECWQTVALAGNAHKDYAALVARCGAATGAIEYVKPASGKLHHERDKRDTFIVKIRGGLCYRFFGVGDGSIQNLDVLIERPGGVLVGDDKTNGPVAIIDSDRAWCMDSDGEYDFLVQIDGGQGSYVFGVWARPPQK